MIEGASIDKQSHQMDSDCWILETLEFDRTVKVAQDFAVGIYELAKFPKYTMVADGYPQTTDVDRKMLIGYGANADRYETGFANESPTQDSLQPFTGQAPLNGYPADPNVRNKERGFLVTGRVQGDSAVHTATDVPLSAFGVCAERFIGLYDNTDVMFRMGELDVAQAVALIALSSVTLLQSVRVSAL